MSGWENEKSRAWIELDMAALEHNVRALSSLLPPGCALMPALKANAYGHGAGLMGRELNRLGIESFCVACLEEAVELREAGVKGEILILGYTPARQRQRLLQYDLSQTAVDYQHAWELARVKEAVKVHIAVDTGMHRLGLDYKESEKLARLLTLEGLKVEGIFSHLCTADGGDSEAVAFALRQLSAFRNLLRELGKEGCFPRAHILGSSGLLHYSPFAGALVRPGIALYGVLSGREELSRCSIELRPVLSLRARLALVRELGKGEALGYGLDYAAREKSRIGVLTIGYGDGLPRGLSGGRVLIAGELCPIIGRICMDQCFVDLGGAPGARQGDEAVLIGSSRGRSLEAYELAEAAGTITNEILCRLGPRLPRCLK